MSVEDFLKVQRDVDDARAPKRKHPSGWEPGFDTQKQTLVAATSSSTPPTDWTTIIANLGLDIEQWTVDETASVQVRSWDTAGGERLYYYKATILPKRDAEQDADIDALIREVKKVRSKKPKPVSTEKDRALLVALSDWQTGKSDGGGAEALLDRLWSLYHAVPERVAELKKMGKPITHLYVVTMGDMVEGCGGNPHYPSQDWNVELDRRQQVKLVRRMLTEMIRHWSKLAPQVVVASVPGNHGELRVNGKFVTTPEDNDDVAVVEMVHEILRENTDAYGHISWVIPDGDMTVTLDVCGTICAFAHGHQARGGAKPHDKIMNWWKNKMLAGHPVGDAAIITTGHYHHLICVQDGPRTHFQCPSNDGKSRWWEESGGAPTNNGTLTYLVDDEGWSDMKVI